MRATRLSRPGSRVELAGKPGIAEVVAQQLGRDRLVAGRVDGVQAQELLQEPDRLVRSVVVAMTGCEHTGGVSDLFSDAAEARRRNGSAGRAPAPGAAAGLRRPGRDRRRRLGARPGDRRGPGPGQPSSTGRRARKTTLARIIAGATGAAFEELSAVSASVADVRAVLARAKERLGAEGRRTILFLDEIHRFNKAQQDALLPAVESGLLTLIGATTENPYFEVNSALLSRTQVYELQPLARDEVAVIVRRGAESLRADVPDELVELISVKAGGDARSALNVLELAWSTAQSEEATLEARHVEDAARRRPVVYDKGGDAHYDFTSAFIKSIRGSDPDAALYYLAAMLEGGEDPRFIARRLIVHASEDVGMADSQALSSRPLRRAVERGAAGGAAQPRPRDHLPGDRAEVECRGEGDRRRPPRRARAGGRPSAQVAPGHQLPRRDEARPRRGLRLPAGRPGRLRRRPPPGGAEGPATTSPPAE